MDKLTLIQRQEKDKYFSGEKEVKVHRDVSSADNKKTSKAIENYILNSDEQFLLSKEDTEEKYNSIMRLIEDVKVVLDCKPSLRISYLNEVSFIHYKFITKKGEINGVKYTVMDFQDYEL